MPIFKACLAQVKAGTGNCNVVLIGESTGAATGSQYSATGADSACCGFLKQAAGTLSSVYGISTQANDFLGNKVVDGATGANAVFLASDQRVTSLGNWFIFTGGAPGLGGYSFVNNDATAITFRPTDSTTFPSTAAIQTNSVDVYANGGSYSVNIGGGAICTPTNGGITTCAATLGNNTYTITCTSGAFSCSLQGLLAWNTSVPSLRFINGSFGGATIAQQEANIGYIQAFSPALCIINDLGNDIANLTAPATYQASLLAVVNACKASGDVLLTTGVIGDAPLGAPCTQCADIRNAVKAVAASTNSPIWDSGALIVSPTANDNYAWNAANNGAAQDPNHQGAAGYAVYGTFLAQILAN